VCSCACMADSWRLYRVVHSLCFFRSASASFSRFAGCCEMDVHAMQCLWGFNTVSISLIVPAAVAACLMQILPTAAGCIRLHHLQGSCLMQSILVANAHRVEKWENARANLGGSVLSQLLCLCTFTTWSRVCSLSNLCLLGRGLSTVI
jgi:hypothetical protein